MEPTVAEKIPVDLRPSRVSWGAVFAGWLIAFSVAMLFYLLGSAIGISTIDASDAQAVNKGLTFGTVFWVFLTWVVSLFMGGY